MQIMKTFTSLDFQKWGAQGGKARSKNTSARRRKQIAKLAVAAREKKRGNPKYLTGPKLTG